MFMQNTAVLAMAPVGLGFFRDDNPFIVPPVICDIHKNGKHA
jgi:hypothetical protein